MNDKSIIELFNKRDEPAIEKSKKQYGAYCTAIAYRILQNHEDTEECVNDTWLKAWNTIPPEQPRSLSLYLGALTRNTALNRLENKNAKLRGGGELDIVFHEIEAVFATYGDPEKAYEQKELTEYINRFLKTVSKRERNILPCRYFYLYSTEQIAAAHRISQNHVRTILSRTLKKLKQYLEKEEYL